MQTLEPSSNSDSDTDSEENLQPATFINILRKIKDSEMSDSDKIVDMLCDKHISDYVNDVELLTRGQSSNALW